MARPYSNINSFLLANPNRDYSFRRDFSTSTEHNVLLTLSCKKNIEVDWKDISHLEAISNYTMFYLNNGKKLLVSRTMKVFLPKLDAEMFVRVHKSFVINLTYLSQFDVREEMFVQLRDGSKISISRRKKKEFVEKTKKYFSKFGIN
ncbi:LytR/AlgR family response regulator transcription factor [Arcicella rigui]|uniref:LytTR family DNA-binding domain-containing protein n=1 Tax=Arcicella rigui TaxID=797020 RepID=A0ABU5QA99_9BACT|nr:LytTR family DNA-binding domain-containing protein [Arcicella rigui]MEA5139770.1 LytTR family DNA-binding domain-containing protein [Arcicella rigui]